MMANAKLEESTISSIDAGKTLCELSEWSLSNLKIHKILYIAHMWHLGLHDNEPLINDGFQAWTYGPVAPPLYHHAKGFGARPVQNVFRRYEGAEGTKREVLENVYEATKNMSGGKLVAVTHWEGGAWRKAYIPGVSGIPIPNRNILQEFLDRIENHEKRTAK